MPWKRLFIPIGAGRDVAVLEIGKENYKRAEEYVNELDRALGNDSEWGGKFYKRLEVLIRMVAKPQWYD